GIGLCPYFTGDYLQNSEERASPTEHEPDGIVTLGTLVGSSSHCVQDEGKPEQGGAGHGKMKKKRCPARTRPQAGRVGGPMYEQLFPHLSTLCDIDQVRLSEGVLRLEAHVRQPSAICPSCGQPSGRVHSHYTR